MLLGLGTAMVYPTLLAAIGDVAHSVWRARAVGVTGCGAMAVSVDGPECWRRRQGAASSPIRVCARVMRWIWAG